jgi:hypothetical protein
MKRISAFIIAKITKNTIDRGLGETFFRDYNNAMSKKIFKIGLICFISITLLWFLYLKLANPFDSDEGLVLGGAWRLWQGEKIYTDFFEYVTPGSFYLIYWVWNIFDTPSYLLAKAFSLLCLLLSAFGVYLISKKSGLNKNFSMASAATFIYIAMAWPTLSYNIIVLPFLIWSSWAFLAFIKNKKNSFLALSAILSGFSALILQHKFVAIFVANLIFLSIYFLKTGKTKELPKKLAIFLPLSILPLFLLFLWPFQTIYETFFLLPLFNYVKTSTMGLAYFPIASALWFFVFLLSIKKSSLEIKYLLCLQAFFYLGNIQRADFLHLTAVSFPLIIMAWKLLQDRVKKHQPLIGLILLPIILILLVAQASNLFLYKIGSKKAETLYKEYVQKNCSDEYIYTGPFLPGFYFYLQKTPPFKSDFLLYGVNSPKDFDLVVKKLEDKKPSCVFSGHKICQYMPVDKNNQADEFIEKNYYKDADIGNIEIYKIKNAGQ